jgi:hypothetical protein
MRRVLVHIDRLVLAGMRDLDPRRFAADVKSALARLLAQPGAPARLAARGALARIDAGKVTVPSRGRARTSAAVAQAIARGLLR